jgi:hypothetical protein
VTAGNFIFSGVGTLTDNSTSTTSIDTTALLNTAVIDSVLTAAHGAGSWQSGGGGAGGVNIGELIAILEALR